MQPLISIVLLITPCLGKKTRLGPAGENQHAFLEFMQQHARNYSVHTDEYEKRFALFETRRAEVERLNARPDRLWEARANHLSDWTEDELSALYGYANHASGQGNSASRPATSLRQVRRAVVVKQEQLWSPLALKSVDNQGHCGSCWAVAAAKMAEANYEIMTKKQRTFSAQQLVDCVPNPGQCGGEGGCKGATVELAMLFMSQDGLATKEAEPYHGKDRKCTRLSNSGSLAQTGTDTAGRFGTSVLGMTMDELFTPGPQVAQPAAMTSVGFLGWARLPINEQQPLLEALNEGTVAVSAAASTWHLYDGGVFDGCDQKNVVINHAILAIGYGKDHSTGKDFFLIQNSWGDQWGEKGRIKILRKDEEYCGNDDNPKAGTACKDGPASVTVCGMCGLFYDMVSARFGDAASLPL